MSIGTDSANLRPPLGSGLLPRAWTTFPRIRRDLIDLTRAEDWWDYKLVPILTVFFATALVLHVSVSSMWANALLLVVAVVTAAVFASSINELTDRADDAAAGKRNRAVDRPRAIAALLGVATGASVAFASLWRHHTLLLGCYVATLLAFALYSLPPLRLKKRGAPGALCCAAGEQMFPALAAVFITSLGAHRAVTGVWIATVAVWALALGSRGILWHQVSDLDNDRAAGVQTFALKSPRATSVIGTFVVFPLELGAFAAILWQVGGAVPAAFLGLYALYAIRSARRHIAPVIVAPKPRYFHVLLYFYTDLFPVALVIAASLRDPRDLVILAVLLLRYPRGVIPAIRRRMPSSRRQPPSGSAPRRTRRWWRPHHPTARPCP